MKSVVHLQEKLEELIQNGSLKVESTKADRYRDFITLVLGKPAFSINDTPPQYCVQGRPEESTTYALMRRLLLEPLRLDSMLSELHEVSEPVQEFLKEAEEIASDIRGNEFLIKSALSNEHQPVEVYQLNKDKVLRMHPDLHNTLTMYGCPYNLEDDIGEYYVKVATISVPAGINAAEAAYELTQIKEGVDWATNPGVDCHIGKARSSKVGDIMVVDGKAHIVNPKGFREAYVFNPPSAEPGRYRNSDPGLTK